MLSKFFKKKKIIITHSGNFHPDDIFGVATLLLMFEKQYRIKIIRTRDRREIDRADFVVDIGDKYDPENNRFDHHQEGGAGIRKNNIPYASFGLVWKKYGEAISQSKEVAEGIENKLALPIDARDNGIDIINIVYHDVIPYEIGNLMNAFSTTWKEDQKCLDTRFVKLVNLAKEVLAREVIHLKDTNEAKEHIIFEYNKLSDKRLLILHKYYPYNSFVDDIPDTLLVVYPDVSEGNWCVKTVDEEVRSYKSRLLLPENWTGKRDSLLEKATGVPGSIFCHRNRFLAVVKTKEAAISLAEKALQV